MRTCVASRKKMRRVWAFIIAARKCGFWKRQVTNLMAQFRLGTKSKFMNMVAALTRISAAAKTRRTMRTKVGSMPDLFCLTNLLPPIDAAHDRQLSTAQKAAATGPYPYRARWYLARAHNYLPMEGQLCFVNTAGQR